MLITLFGGYLMKIYAWKTILGNEGVLNTALMASGIIATPISALLYSPGAVVITLIHFACPSRFCRSMPRCAASTTSRSRRRAISAPAARDLLDHHRAALPRRHRRRLQLLVPDHRRRLRHAAAGRRQADDDRQSDRAAVRRACSTGRSASAMSFVMLADLGAGDLAVQPRLVRWWSRL